MVLPHTLDQIQLPTVALLLHRSVRKDPPDAEWKEAEEEEDDNQEEHPQPLLQRVLQLRGPV